MIYVYQVKVEKQSYQQMFFIWQKEIFLYCRLLWRFNWFLSTDIQTIEVNAVFCMYGKYRCVLGSRYVYETRKINCTCLYVWANYPSTFRKLVVTSHLRRVLQSTTYSFSLFFLFLYLVCWWFDFLCMLSAVLCLQFLNFLAFLFIVFLLYFSNICAKC